MKKKLTDLLNDLSDYQYKGPDITVTGVSSDSRKVKKGQVFVAVRGHTVDGHQYIDDVIEKGALAVVGDIEFNPSWIGKIVYVKVSDTRKALGKIASAWFGNPSRYMKVIGITGTDGKTTTANILYHLLTKSGLEAGLVSTISAKIGNRDLDTGFHVTNPDPVDLHSYLYKMQKAGCDYAILEVTSHGIDQGRVEGVEFNYAALTNITHEHIDYHKTFEDYRDTKARLFSLADKAIVLNKDDLSYDFIKQKRENESEVLSYSVKEKADIYATDIISTQKGSTFTLHTLNSTKKVTLNLPGHYNISNALAAVGIAKLCGLSDVEISCALNSFQSLSGRMEEIPNKKGFRTIVDFAHTPNSLEKVLTTLKENTKGKVICVYGCAGRRDVKKRELMPEVSCRIADVSIFTAEDPRDEDLEKILSIMEKAGSKFAFKFAQNENAKIKQSKEKKWFISIPERGEAISFAIQKIAQKGDTVVVCGKGHEKSMAYGNVEYPWSDQKAVSQSLKNKTLTIKRDSNK